MSTKRKGGKAGRPAREPGEKSTKEKILDVAITQFSERGYDSVSMREIAGAVGIRESAIYRHYKGKEHIMDAIIDFLVAGFKPGSGEAPMEALLEQYGPEGFVDRAARATMERTKEPQIRMINRIICIELYRNEKIREFFLHKFKEPSYQMWEQIFRTMIDRGYIGECDVERIAVELANYSIYLYLDSFLIRYDQASYDRLVDDMMDDFSRHIRFVFKTVRVNGKGKRKQSKKQMIRHE